MSRSRRHLTTAILLLMTTLAYAPSLSHDFQFDDVSKVRKNPRMLDARSLIEAFRRSGYSEDTTRLIPNLTLCADAALSRWWTGGGLRSDSVGAGQPSAPWLDPLRFNVTNLLIHLANVWLVLRLGRATWRRLGRKDETVPLLAAMLFALHPLNTEAVLYCNARPNTLATLFFIATLLQGMRLARGRSGGARRAVRRTALLLSFVAALLSKELAVTLVVMLPLIVSWTRRDPPEREQPGSPRLAVAAGLAAAAGLAIALLTGAISGAAGRVAQDPDPAVTGSLTWRLFFNGIGQAWILMRYLGLALLPLPRFLSAEHGAPHLHALLAPAEGPPAPAAFALLAISLLAMAAWTAAAVAAVRMRHRFPAESIFFLWMLVTHAPTSLVPRDEPMVEYRTYLPMVGLCLLLARGILAGRDAIERRRSWTPAGVRAFRWGTGLALLAALVSGILLRTPSWMTQVDFWRDVTSKMDPASTRPWARYRAWVNYGTALAELPVRRTPEALAALETAISVDPTRWQAYAARGSLYLESKAYDAAIRDLTLALQLGAPSTTPPIDLVTAHLGRRDIGAAWDVMRQTVSRHPGNAILYHQFARMLQTRMNRPDKAADWLALASAVEPFTLKRVGEAVRRLETYLQQHPASVEGHLALGLCIQEEPEWKARGEAALRRVIEIEPHGPAHREALRMLGEAAWKDGRWDEGQQWYRQLLEAHPSDYEALLRYGFFLLDRAGNRVEAHRYLTRAIEINPMHPSSILTRRRLAAP